MTRIMDRTKGRSRITVSVAFGLFLMAPAAAQAGQIASTQSADALREVATASSSPLSNGSITAILNAGTPVAETTTTTNSDGTAQTADVLIAPDTSAGTVTITKDINLADGQTEKAVDVATVSGDTTKNMITTTLPDGSVQTKHETDVTKGDTTTIRGTVSTPGAGTQTITGETVRQGSESVTTLAITNPAGQVFHDRIVITHSGQLSQSETNTTRGPDGSVSTVTSITSTVLNPGAVVQSAIQESLSIPSLGSATTAPAAEIEAQVLAIPSATSEVAPTILPAALPEPSTLTLFGIVVGVAVLRRGWNRLTAR
jgi:hypothetical protein